MDTTTDTHTNAGDTGARPSEVALDALVGQVWERVKTGERLRLRKIECGDALVFECIPPRLLTNRCVYFLDAWLALVEQGHYRLLPNH